MYRYSTPAAGSIEWIIEDQTFSPSYDYDFAPPPPPLSNQ